MAINVFQVSDLMSTMFTSSSFPSTGSNALQDGENPSEFPLVADNINGSLARYTKIMGVWGAFTYNASHTVSNPSWSQDNGNGANGFPWRPAGGFFIRSTFFANEPSFWGYVGSIVGGYVNQDYSHDSNGSTVDYEPLYGHGSTVVYPMANNQAQQFRDSNNLPADGTSVITSTGSAYNRGAYRPPASFVLFMANGNTIGSGAIKFLVEQRPTSIQSNDSRSPLDGDRYEYFTASQVRKLNSRRLSILWGRVFIGNTTGTDTMYAYPLEEDGTTNVGGTPMTSVYASNATDFSTGSPTSRAAATAFDMRVREHAMFYINDEYYGVVQETKCAIFSNKSNIIPLLFVDLADTWGQKIGHITNVSLTSNVATVTVPNSFSVGQQISLYNLTGATFLNGQVLTVVTASGTQFTASFTHADYTSAADVGVALALGKRIAGVVSTGTSGSNKIYFLSEQGDLAIYDFTVSGGAISALASAPTLASGEAYSSLKVSNDGLKLYALGGSMAIDPRFSSSGTGRVGVTTYTILSNTWGTAQNSPLLGRVNARSLNEMIVLRDGRIGMMVEKVNVSAGTVTNFSSTAAITNIALTTNVVTVTAINNLVSGQTVTFSGLTTATYLNGQTVTVNASGLSGTSFTANFTHANDTTHADTGIATATVPTNTAWQFMILDPAGPTWNTGQIDGGTTTPFTYGNTYTKWGINIQSSVHDVKTNKVLILGNWTNVSLAVIDISGATAGINNSNITVVGQGSGHNIFPAGVNFSDFVQVRKSRTDDRTIFWHSNHDPFQSPNSTPAFYMAPPSYAWDGTVLLSTVNRNASDANGVTLTFDKDKYTAQSLVTPGLNLQSNSPDGLSILAFFVEGYVPLIINGGIRTVFVGEFGILPGAGQYAQHNAQGIIYMPTYYKTGNVLADSWQDAATNGYVVPATPATNIGLPYGLQVQFTPNAGTTFGTNEWHTFNVALGTVKFQRKARYTWVMFAGQTFENTESRTLTALNAITPWIATGSWSAVFSGPSSRTDGADNFVTRTFWPKAIAGAPQNTAAQMVLTFANSPDSTTLINVPGDGKVVTQSSQNVVATNAFNGNPTSFWRSNASGTQWIQLDMGSSVTVNSYALRFNLATTAEAPASWILQGSATGTFTGEQVTVDSQTLPSPMYGSPAFNCATPGSYRYYRITASNGVSFTQLGSIQFFSAVLTNVVNFSEISLFGADFSRGYTWEVSFDGTNFSLITPLWRSHIGTIFCFPRQTGVQKVRITVQQGQNRDATNAEIGPFEFHDYGTQAQMDAARLGLTGAADGTPTRGSFDTQFLGIANDCVTISLDGDSPFLHAPSSTAENNSVYVFNNWQTIAAGQYMVHPFWGFVMLPGGGAVGQKSTQAGTSLSITYNWGRRV